MRKYIILILLAPTQIFAKAPECPMYNNKQECLHFVKSNYEDFLKFIDENTDAEDSIEKTKLIQASLDIKKYESLACEKTCLN